MHTHSDEDTEDIDDDESDEDEDDEIEGDVDESDDEADDDLMVNTEKVFHFFSNCQNPSTYRE